MVMDMLRTTDGRTYLTLRETERMYGVRYQTLARAIKNGELHAHRVGHYLVIDLDEFLKWRRELYGTARHLRKKILEEEGNK